MKDKILQALRDSRALVRDQIEYERCTHSGHYAEDDFDCQICEFGFECQWLYRNDEFVSLERRSADSLLESLEFAIIYIDSSIERWGHDRRACRCDACCWLRNSQRLRDELQKNTD